MKKGMALLLAVLLLALALAGCGSGKKPDADAAVEKAGEGILLDQDGIRITGKGMDPKAPNGPTLFMEVENTSEKTVRLEIQNFCLEGAVVEPYMEYSIGEEHYYDMSLTLEAGEKRECSLYGSNPFYVKACGIDTVSEMEFRVKAYVEETGEDLFTSPVLTVKTGEAAATRDVPGSVIYDKDGIRIILEGEDSDSDFNPVVYVKNGTGEDIMVECFYLSVDGKEIEPWHSSVIYAGKAAVSLVGIPFDEEVSSFTEIEIAFKVYKYDPMGFPEDNLLLETEKVKVTDVPQLEIV